MIRGWAAARAMNTSGRAVCDYVRRHVAHHNRTRSDNGVFCDSNLRDANDPGPEKRRTLYRNGASEGRSRTDVNVIADKAVMIEPDTCVQNAISTNFGVSVYDNASHYNGALANSRGRRDAREWMNYRMRDATPQSEALKNSRAR